jgi:dihydropteroate synthase
MLLRAGKFEYVFPRPALVMGIVNATPDSFSDGGRFLDAEAAIAHGLRLAEQGAEIIDVGGESTRPNAVPVSETEEMRRVLPVIEALAPRLRIPISIDTMKPAVARAAVRAGAAIINDIAANRGADAMDRLVAESGAGYICMHMQGTPATMQVNPRYQDVVGEVREFFQTHLRRLQDCGVSEEQVILDPGIGFGKTLEHNVRLLGALREFAALKRPVALGVSRKTFLGKLGGGEPTQRLPGALACACLAVADGAAILRVHDVAETVQAVRTAEAILNARKNL